MMDCSMNSHPWCWSSCGLPAELPDFPQMGLQCHDQCLIIGYFSLFGSDLIRYVTKWLTGLWQVIQEIRRKIMKKTGRYRGRMTEKGKVGRPDGSRRNCFLFITLCHPPALLNLPRQAAEQQSSSSWHLGVPCQLQQWDLFLPKVRLWLHQHLNFM